MALYGTPLAMPIGGKAASGSRMFLGVTLPRSLYYEQAAEWLQIKDNTRAVVGETQYDGQVVCGNALWELYGNHAYSYSLDTGELLEDVPLSGISTALQYCNAIATDGVSRIWFVRRKIQTPVLQALDGSNNGNWEYQQYVQAHLYEFDTTSKSTKSLCIGEVKNNIQFDNNSSTAPRISDSPNAFLYNGIGLIGYSKSSNKVYFGAIPYTSSGGLIYYYTSSSTGTSRGITSKSFHKSVWEYDLFSTTYKELANTPASSPFRGRYFYDDGDFFYMGNGYANLEREQRIYRYNKQSNTWETVVSGFLGYTDGHFSYVNLGDKMLQISLSATGVFDPKSGSLDPSPVPVIPPGVTPMYPGFVAYENNTLYLVNEKGVYKCPFYTSVPNDAPIVAKIYKGQKYHSLEPFEIPNKISFTRTQQIADQDIEIKMYEYSSEGGQTIYIEDTGDEK